MSEVIVPRGALPERLLRTLRGTAGRRLRRKWEIHERGIGHVPAKGPLILASNHIGWLDGPLLVGVAPRPVHALVKSEAYEESSKNALLLRGTGQIKIRRKGVDAGAIRRAVSALHHEQALLMFPEGSRGAGDFASIFPGIAYLSIVTGAPIVPVAVFGTREGDEDPESKPPKGRRIEIHYGRSFWFSPIDPPRRQEDISAAAHEIHVRLQRHLETARQNSKVELPNPLRGRAHD